MLTAHFHNVTDISQSKILSNTQQELIKLRIMNGKLWAILKYDTRSLQSIILDNHKIFPMHNHIAFESVVIFSFSMSHHKYLHYFEFFPK